MSAYQFSQRNRVARVVGIVIAQNACKKVECLERNWDLLPSRTPSWRVPVCESVCCWCVLLFVVARFVDEKNRKVHTMLRSAAFTFVTQKWKSIYSAEICCFQFFHRFAPKNGKACAMLRSAALKFVAVPRKGPAMNPGFLITNLIRDKKLFCA